jgi:hypothetical protein
MTRTFIAGLATVLIVGSAGLVAQGQQSPPTAPPRFNGFGVSLVLGEMQGSAAPAKLPPGAARALADLKDFLPYRNYRVLDTLWMPQSDSTPQKLHGVESAEYQLSISGAEVSAGSVKVGTVSLYGVGVDARTNTLYQQGVISKGAFDAAFVNQRSPLISTSFTINFDETIVVGTSRLQGDRALILLITALTH